MCVSDAVLYHCSKDNYESEVGNGKGGKWRWVCAAALSLVFPCLCCYLPLKGCQKVTEAAYEKATNNGCKCEEQQANVIAADSTTTVSSAAPSSPVSGGGDDSGIGGSGGNDGSRMIGSDKRLLG